MSGGDSTQNSSEESKAQDAPDPLVGAVIAGRYRVDERLGVGGMGAVYRAEHVLMQKSVAVKVLHREMTVLDEVVKRFEREAIAAGRIDHPNVTVATDFGKLENGSFYLVLEYVPGRSLTKALEEDGAFGAERALFIARQVAAALGAAHAAGIVHRDLKPDNIMLIERGGTKDFVKVLDFGIAKVSGAGETTGALTQIGSVFGTPQYMAPEQAAGKPVDHRADLYALGLVLYEMLAGKPAFSSPEIVGLLTKQLIEPPPPLPESVPKEVSELVMKLAEKDPDARPQTAQDLMLAIDAFLGPAALPPDSSVLGALSMRGVPSSSGGSAAASAVPAVTSLGGAATSLGAGALVAVRERVSELARRTARGDTVRVAGRDVPLRVVVVAGAAVLVGALSTVALRGGGSHPNPTGGAASAIAPPPDIAGLLARAAEGEPSAIAKLEARPEADRSALEWLAIAKGRLKLGESKKGLDAVRHAVALDAALSQDHDLLVYVRRAADDPLVQKDVMELSATTLGAGGADLLFDIWASTLEKTETTALAKTFLDRDDVRTHATPALRLALDLRRTNRCEDYKRLLPVAKEIGDERAFRPLNQLNSRKGCGFLSLGDCYSCLRGDDSVREALKAVQSRKGPRL